MSFEPTTAHPGHPFPLGAHPVGGGTRFAVASAAAERVQLCLVDEAGTERRVELTERTFGVWHGVVAGVGPGQRYGYRVHGPWEPGRDLALDPSKLLLDPAARRITGALGDADRLTTRGADTLGHVPLSVVTAAPGPVTPGPRVPFEETVIYELHVGSFTARHPDVPPELRGTYPGLAHPAVVAHLTDLGVTAVELLPVHAFLDEPPVRARGMRNHWGYSTAAYSAPHPGYASRPGAEVEEFTAMVAALHDAGLEVLLDVVYNHTCEGGADGPTVGLRGYGGYYLHDSAGLLDLTGCGNTLDPAAPVVVGLVLDSLRHWAALGVDGFRFDLASALGRPGGGAFDPRAPLLTAITTDPVLRGLKLVAEPWDATGPGYQVGGFGVQWAEWNDRFRDTVREYWNGGSGRRELASRLSGSEDLYAASGRRPWASTNFVTAHDGFTLADLVSHERKHNEANGEHGRDGTDHNHSVNHGVEGATDDPRVRAARDRHVRALLATLLLSTGTPMLLAGDELGHTQGGNNNAYCAPAGDPQAWALDWAGADTDLLAYVRRVLALRRAAPALRQPEFFTGRATPTGEPDLVWFGADGVELDAAGWHDEDARVLQVWVDGDDVRSRGRDGTRLTDTSWLLVLNSGPARDVALPPVGPLELVLDSTTPTGAPAARTRYTGGETVRVPRCTVAALRARA